MEVEHCEPKEGFQVPMLIILISSEEIYYSSIYYSKITIQVIEPLAVTFFGACIKYKVSSLVLSKHYQQWSALVAVNAV